MSKTFKILMVLHMPWDPNFGGPKIQIELANEFRKLGHTVKKFDYYDAFPELKSSPNPLLWRVKQFFDPTFGMTSFATKAKTFIQNNGHNFDVIDAHQGDLPFSKKELQFDGLLVSRTAGFYAFHQQFKELVQKTWNLPGSKNIFRRLVWQWRKLQQKRETQNYVNSFQEADGIIVSNPDELTYVEDILGIRNKCISLPNGLTQQQHIDFSSSAQTSEIRLASKQIVFIGSWGLGKGSRDWPEIISEVRQQIPDASFLFLGVKGYSSSDILKDLNSSDCDWLQIIPSYQNIELPILLANSTVGAFPSYIEGFGIAVLEQLSSGLPVVAYDIPGPRVMLNCLDSSLLVPAGDTEQFSQKIIELISLDKTSYTKLSEQCVEVAQKFEWHGIAKETLGAYNTFLELQK
jgi:glycosyltransferase involved in cell wall biosynthesis